MTITAQQLVEAVNKILPLPGIASIIDDMCYGIGIRQKHGLTAHQHLEISNAEAFIIGSIVTELAKRGWTISTMSGGKRGVWIFGGRNINDSSHGVLGYSGSTDALAWCDAFRQAKEAADAS